MAASTSHGSASRASPTAPTVEISPNLRSQIFLATMPRCRRWLSSFRISITTCITASRGKVSRHATPGFEQTSAVIINGADPQQPAHRSLLIVTFDENDAKDTSLRTIEAMHGLPKSADTAAKTCGAGIADETIVTGVFEPPPSLPATLIITLFVRRLVALETPPRRARNRAPWPFRKRRRPATSQ